MQHPAAQLKAHNLRASKKRGQNFLTQPATALAIASSAGIRADDVVFEIGGGLGALTIAAASLAARVLVLELDRGVYPLLKQNLAEAGAQNVEAIQGDALHQDLEAMAGDAGSPLVVVGNLPYAITSPLLFMLIENLKAWRSASLMMQLEVARRLISGPGSKDYGRLSVLVQTYCEVKQGHKVGPDQFFPRPQVDSQVVHLKPRDEPLVDLTSKQARIKFSTVVKAGFSQRRKTLANSLAGGLGLSRPEVAEYIRDAGIEPSQRAETLTPQDFAAIARLIELPQATDGDTEDS
jgi:16S rRNA (adenine1518-N6/adenine1519-N6)-dimethyltransferase